MNAATNVSTDGDPGAAAHANPQGAPEEPLQAAATQLATFAGTLAGTVAGAFAAPVAAAVAVSQAPIEAAAPDDEGGEAPGPGEDDSGEEGHAADAEPPAETRVD